MNFENKGKKTDNVLNYFWLMRQFTTTVFDGSTFPSS